MNAYVSNALDIDWSLTFNLSFVAHIFDKGNIYTSVVVLVFSQPMCIYILCINIVKSIGHLHCYFVKKSVYLFTFLHVLSRLRNCTSEALSIALYCMLSFWA